jgi:hypothetical protein
MSKTPVNPPPPKTPPPPRRPPTKPPNKAADDVFALAASLGEDVARDLARPHKPSPPSKPPRKPINTKPIRAASPQTPARPGPVETGSWKAGGPVPRPQMPKPVGPPRFVAGERRLVGAVWPPEGPFPGSPPGPPPDPGPRAGGPPPRPKPTGPVPHPPPPFVLGVGVPYDSLPPADDRTFRDRVRSNP